MKLSFLGSQIFFREINFTKISWNWFHEKKVTQFFFYFQVEFYWLLPFVYDDLSYPMWWMDRTIVGLYASRRESGKFFFIFSGEKKPNYFLMLIYYQSWIFFNSRSSIKRKKIYVQKNMFVQLQNIPNFNQWHD